MTTQTVQLLDRYRTVIAIAHVADEGDHSDGTIDLRQTPSGIRALFDEFEEIVNGQTFSLLDEIQEKIGRLPIRVVFADGTGADIHDLQVYPGTGDVSFRLAETKNANVNRANASAIVSPATLSISSLPNVA